MNEPTEEAFMNILIGEQATDDQIEELETAGLMHLESEAAIIYRYYERSTQDGVTLQFTSQLLENDLTLPAEVTMNILTDDLVEPRFALSYDGHNLLFYTGMNEDDTPTGIADLLDKLTSEADLTALERALLGFFSGRLRDEEETSEGGLASGLLHPSVGVAHPADLMRRLIESNSMHFVRTRECNFRTVSGKEVLVVSNQPCNGVPEEDLDDFPVLQLFVDDLASGYSYGYTLEQSGARAYTVREIAVQRAKDLTYDQESEIANFRAGLFGEGMSADDATLLLNALAEEQVEGESESL